MDVGLAWIGELVAWFAQWVPRWALCPPTHRGVKFVGSFFKRSQMTVQRIEPGLYWWWPAATEVYTIPVVRQSVDLPTQSLDTKNGHALMVSTVLVVEITDIVKALTKNYDIDDTIKEVGAAAAVDCVATRELGTFRRDFAKGTIEQELLEQAQKLLRRYGVKVIDARFTDCCVHKPIRVEGGGATVVPTEE